MFFSNNTLAHNDLVLRAAIQDASHRQHNHIELVHISKTHVNRSIRAALMALALLGGAGIFAMQLSSPAFAEETNADAAAKYQKHKRELANPGSYVLKQKQTKIDANTADSAIIIEKKKKDYEKLAASVKALTTALKRESEKAGVNNSDVFAKVESSSKEAEKLAKSGAYDEAHQTLEVGYHLLTGTVVKLENLKDQGEGDKSDRALAAKPEATPIDPREHVEHELKTNNALLTALKHQNEDKAGGKADEIEAIKATADEARAALKAGDIDLANDLIKDANSRTKKAIASLQKAPSMLSGSAAVDEAAHHPADMAHEEGLKKDYAKRKTSVIALLEAGRRLDTEHGTSHTEFASAESMLNEADALAADGKLGIGKDRLDRAYLLIKDTMRNMLSLKEPKPVSRSAAPKAKKKPAKVRTDAQQ